MIRNFVRGTKAFLIISLFLLPFSNNSYSQKKQEIIDVMAPKNKTSKFSPDAFIISGDFHLNKIINRKKGLKGMSACHLNLADAADPQNYSLCKKLGLSVIVSKAPPLSPSAWMKFSDQEIDDYIKKMVNKAGHHKAIIGYYLCDEPSALAFPALAKAVAAVKKYASGKLAVINLYPNYATIWKMNKTKSQLGTKTYMEYLEKYVNEVKPQVISYDNYMVELSMDLQDRKKAESYFTNLLEVRRIALKYNIPFWNVVSSNQIRPFTTIPSPANLAFQAYTSLAAGAGGIRWYTYHGKRYDYNPLDKQENRTLTWRYLEEINRQLSIVGPVIKNLSSTGVYFTSPAPEAPIAGLPGKWVQKVETTVPMMVGEFKSVNDTNYVMVVNLSLEKSARFDLTTGIPNERLSMLTLGENGEFVNVKGEHGIWLTAGQGVLIKCGGESFTEPKEKKSK
jgi:hypothetical protein